jgi:hypothetical protein
MRGKSPKRSTASPHERTAKMIELSCVVALAMIFVVVERWIEFNRA